MTAAASRKPDGDRRGLPLSGGFTLIEVLIAVAILSVICIVLYGSFSSVLNTAERVRTDQQRLRIMNSLVTHFQENISGAYLSFDFDTRPAGRDFLGKDEEIDGVPADTLTFRTTAGRTGGAALPGDTKEVSYTIIEEEDGWYVLTVHEKARLLNVPNSEDEDDDELGEPSWQVPVASLNFEYYDGTAWSDSWDSAKKGLPRGVRVEAHFLEEEIELLLEDAGIEIPVMDILVTIPRGISGENRGT